MIIIKIDNIDRSGIIEFNSVDKSDILNNQTDYLSFVITYHPAQTFRPEVGSEVVMEDGAEKVFGGKIYAIEKQNNGDGSVAYTVKAKDYFYDLDRLRVIEGYDDKTAGEIIIDIIDKYAPTFTYNYVDCDLVIEKISFNREKISDCLGRLSGLTGYSFYADYDKDIHFFKKNSEPAPFNLTDISNNYIVDSLMAEDDVSQIRNRVFIRGGEIEGEERTEYFNGDGTKKQFKLANKFSKLPVVEVGGSPVSVGVDNIDDEASFDCFWDFNQQYIRFKDTTIPPAGANNITATAKFLYNLVVQVDEPTSISKYGMFEYAKSDARIKSRKTAVQMAKTELEAYRNGLVEGGFQTYAPGLRSGQIINITSELMGVAEDFLIQKVSFKMISPSIGVWTAELATLRAVGIIDFLIDLLKAEGRIAGDTGDAILEKTIFPIEQINFSETTGINTEEHPADEIGEAGDSTTVQALDYDVDFCWGVFAPTGTKRMFLIGNTPIE